jgi:hypothetical protein
MPPRISWEFRTNPQIDDPRAVDFHAIGMNFTHSLAEHALQREGRRAGDPCRRPATALRCQSVSARDGRFAAEGSDRARVTLRDGTGRFSVESKSVS